ncbi:MAG: hypothetical protein ACXAC7_17945 [Candidatus Hodarchaeales archaeon]|jgi:hypothetical protein
MQHYKKTKISTIALLIIGFLICLHPPSGQSILFPEYYNSKITFEEPIFSIGEFINNQTLFVEYDFPDSSYVTDPNITISDEQSVEGDQSVKMELNGLGDDGTAWICFAILNIFLGTADQLISFNLTGYVWSPEQSDFNNFQVKSYNGFERPTHQDNFTTIGYTGKVEGWYQYNYTEQVKLPISESIIPVYFALGLRVAYETPSRTYFIDNIEFEVTNIQNTTDPIDTSTSSSTTPITSSSSTPITSSSSTPITSSNSISSSDSSSKTNALDTLSDSENVNADFTLSIVIFLASSIILYHKRKRRIE